MQRRKFIGTGAALAALTAPKWLQAQACAPTLADRYGYGPYYVANAPEGAQIGKASEPGEKLNISGTVSNCRGNLAGVKLELWQATHSGCYIHPSMRCDGVPGNDTDARLWGHLVSNAYGAFAFNTIKPGRYLNGARYRPSHIHFRITTPSRGNTPGIDLVTQLYFQGDEYIKGDYAADHSSATSWIIPLVRQGDGPWSGVFNVNLPDAPSGLGIRDPLADPALAGFDLAVHRQGSRVIFQLPPAPAGEAVELRLFAPDGRLVKRSLHRVTPIELETALLSRGKYQAEFRWWTSHGLRHEHVSLGI